MLLQRFLIAPDSLILNQLIVGSTSLIDASKPSLKHCLYKSSCGRPSKMFWTEARIGIVDVYLVYAFASRASRHESTWHLRMLTVRTR